MVHTYIHTYTVKPTQEGMVGRQSLFLTDTRALFKRNGIGSLSNKLVRILPG